MPNTRPGARSLFPSHNRLVAVIEAPPPVSAWEQALRQFGARLFEAAPGLVTWVLLGAPAWIPIIFHSSGALFVAVVVLLFDTYWVVRQTVEQMADHVEKLPQGTRIMVLGPVVKGRKGEYRSLIDDVRKSGFVRVRVDGSMYEIGEPIPMDKNKKHDVQVVVDR